MINKIGGQQSSIIREIAQKSFKLSSLFGKRLLQSQQDYSLEAINKILDIILNQVFELKNSFEGYDQMQDMLQRQENLNRTLIKKQLQFREERATMIEDLHREQNHVRKLHEKVNILTEKLKDKQLQILHLQNELKANKREITFFDDKKIDKLLDGKFKKTISKDQFKETYKAGTTSHKRRQSQDFSNKNKPLLKRKESGRKK